MMLACVCGDDNMVVSFQRWIRGGEGQSGQLSPPPPPLSVCCEVISSCFANCAMP